MFQALLPVLLLLPLVKCIYIDSELGLGGNATTARRYPYMVQLQQFMVVNYVHHCGGSLLTPSCILTAAHCTGDEFGSRLLLQAQAGTIYRGSETLGQRRPIVRTVTHERYVQDGKTGPYDIALALVEEPFLLDGVTVATISLLPSDHEQPLTTDVMGFGKIDRDDTLPEVLQVVFCSFRPPTACRERPSEGTFCVGSPGATACQGDSGGPVVATLDGVDWLVGVVSYGLRTCGSGPITCTDVGVDGGALWRTADRRRMMDACQRKLLLLVRAPHRECPIALPAEVDEGGEPDEEQRDEQDEQDEIVVGGEQKDGQTADQQQDDDGEGEENARLPIQLRLDVIERFEQLESALVQILPSQQLLDRTDEESLIESNRWVVASPDVIRHALSIGSIKLTRDATDARKLFNDREELVQLGAD
uniref:Peptidase S1 domain-containing protein n=1 Tax=Anopheles farauti TaxID=69004 RepID=A0A182QEB2_9DIPT